MIRHRGDIAGQPAHLGPVRQIVFISLKVIAFQVMIACMDNPANFDSSEQCRQQAELAMSCELAGSLHRTKRATDTSCKPLAGRSCQCLTCYDSIWDLEAIKVFLCSHKALVRACSPDHRGGQQLVSAHEQMVTDGNIIHFGVHRERAHQSHLADDCNLPGPPAAPLPRKAARCS